MKQQNTKLRYSLVFAVWMAWSFGMTLWFFTPTWEKWLGRCNSVLKSCDTKEAAIELVAGKVLKFSLLGEFINIIDLKWGSTVQIMIPVAPGGKLDLI